MHIGRTSRLIWIAGTLLFFLATATVFAAGAGWPMSKQGIDLVVESPHYRVRTDLGADVGQTVTSQQEALYAELFRRMGSIIKPKTIQRFEVLVFSGQERYLQEVGDAAKGSRGIFMPARGVLACWGSADQFDFILSTLRHEGTHQFVAYFIGDKCPIWLNEGLAVFYEEGEFRAGGLQVGQVVPGRLLAVRQALETNRFIPVSRMLMLTDQEWIGAVQAGSATASLQYDEAWTMVHFLAFGGNQKYRAAFFQFICHIARGEDKARAWERTFGAHYLALEDRWREYVQGLQPDADLDCRMQLRILGTLLYRVRDQADLIKDLPTFRQAVLGGRLGKWSMKTGDVFAIASDEPDRLAALFKCPQDKRPGAETSYELVHDPAGEVPILRCRLHDGIVLETQCVKNAETGRIDVTVVARPAVAVR